MKGLFNGWRTLEETMYLKKALLAMVIFTSLLLVGCKKEEVIALDEESKTYITQEEKEKEESDQKNDDLLYVYVCGQVEKPGVYELLAGSRLFEAIEKAGGVTTEAQEAALNLAEQVTDGAKIYVPSKEEVAKGEAKHAFEAETVQEDGIVSINKATEADLMTLPGIGASKAADIISFREANGGFKSLEELMQVPGIKEGTFNKIKDKIQL